MSAAAQQKPIPLYHEALRFWNVLVQECKRQVEAINRAASSDGIAADDLVRCDLPAPEAESVVRMRKDGSPSTDVKVQLSFQSWGPVIKITSGGEQLSGVKFLHSETDFPVSRDLDGSVVAIFDEGRSFTAAEVSRFAAQNFRRCYPALPLPC